MRLKILHVMSQMELTGAEVYALTLANHQKDCGHEVFVIADELHFPTQAQFHSCPIYDRSYRARLRNIRFLRKFVLSHGIDVVHTHSRAASWVSYYALKFTKVPLISTVHGRQHWHGRLKKNDVYGDQIVAVCENIRNHLIEDFSIRPGKIRTLANPIERAQSRKVSSSSDLRIAILGRTTGPKGERSGEVLEKIGPELLERYSFVKIQVAGGGFERFAPSVQQAYVEMKRKFGDRIQFSCSNADFWEFLLSADLVIGSGRIAAECVTRGIPVFAMGEAATHGIVDDKNIKDILASNFGDIQAQRLMEVKFDVQYIREQLFPWVLKSMEQKRQAKVPTVCPAAIEVVQQNFDAESIFKKTEQIYRLNIFKKNVPRPVPILMYHKVPKVVLNSKHKIFVTVDNFRRQMLTLKRKGFTAIDFCELKQFLTGERSFDEFPKRPILLTFDDGYKDNLENAFPILKEFGFKATVFVLSDFELRRNEWDLRNDPKEPPHELMTADEIKLCQELGISLGSHGRSHRDLTGLTTEESWNEIITSKHELEKAFKAPIVAFAYPYGKYDSIRERQIFDAGYEFAVATDSGSMRFEENPYAIFRVNIFPHDLGISFLKKASAYYRQYFYLKRGR